MGKSVCGTNSSFTVFTPDRERTAQADIHKKCRQKLGWQKVLYARSKGRDYVNAEHNYTLMRGDIDTGRKRTMLGRQAKALNESYEMKFIKDKTQRLWRWKWLSSVE